MENINLVMENKGFKDLNPITFGYNKCTPDKQMNMKRYFYLIHFVISGKGSFVLEGTEYSVSANQIFIIPINAENLYKADHENPWEYIWIGFTGKLAEDFSSLPPVMNFSSNLFYDMLAVHNASTMRQEFLAEKLFSLYRLLLADYTHHDYTKAIQNFIECNYMNFSICVNQIASALNLNRSYLSRAFKKKLGVSIQEFLIQTRIQNALPLLEKGYTVQQVAEQVGYKDAFVFSRIFKKHTGISPSNYKDSCSIT